jgi:Domain of unknown function (DUF4177)
MEACVYEYKCVTQRDSRFSGSLDPDKLENLLNSEAGDGWRVVSGFLASNIMKTSKTHILFVLERELSSQASIGSSES